VRYERELPYHAAATAVPSERVEFIRRTYTHLGVAILAFMALEALLLNVVPFSAIFGLLAVSPYSWLVVLLAFMVASWVAQSWARSATSPAMQYAGLSLYVVIEALIILPLLAICYQLMPPGEGTKLIANAGILTLAVFGGLTLTVFVVRKDFSFMAPILCIGSFIALGVIVAGIVFGFTLGLFFSFVMVALMAGFILFETSQVLFHYGTDQHVAAALALFASIATLFWWILRIMLILNSRD
jgi:FtsH-binding integral membrane protein